MSPEVVAAVIAAGVSFLTLVGTLAAQYFNGRATSRQLERTFGEQRARTLNERFASGAEQLGSDKPSVRLAGVYAMSGLADDWEDNRQTCVEVLCAYLRMPYEPDPGQDAPESQRLAFQAAREVRRTVIRVIAAHIRRDAVTSWQGLNFDFTGAVFDGGDFGGACFSGGTVSFERASFCGGEVHFDGAEFSGGTVFFGGARFTGGRTDFGGARFCGGTVSFRDAEFSGGRVGFTGSQFTSGTVSFSRSCFSGAEISFRVAEFSGSRVGFSGARFSAGEATFTGALFSGGEVYFGGAEFSGSRVYFEDARFTGSEVSFEGAHLSGGMVDLSDVDDWSFPPVHPWTDTQPAGVKLPHTEPPFCH